MKKSLIGRLAAYTFAFVSLLALALPAQALVLM